MTAAQPRPARLSPVLGALLLLLLALARGPGARGVAPFDSTFVGARQASHAAQGEGPHYNRAGHLPQPRHPVASPLGLVLLTGASLLGLDPVGGAVALALLAELVAAGLLLVLLARRPVAAVLVLVLWAALPEMGRVVAGGATPPLALALVLVTCLVAARGGGLATGLAAGAATAAAPEAALVLPGVWLAWPRSIEQMGREGLAFLALVGPTAWGLQHWTGSWQPTPLTTGTQLAWAPALPGLGAAGLLPLAALGAFEARGERTLRPLLVVGLLAALPWLLVGPSLHLRAAYLPLAALAVPAALGLERPLTAFAADFSRRTRVAGAAVGALALVAVGVAGLPRTAPALRAHVWEPLATWAHASGVDDSRTRLLASEIGFTGWFAGGVVQPAARGEAALVAQLLTLQPDYLLLRAARPELSALRSSGELARTWYPIERFSIRGESALDPDLADLAEDAPGDYLLFCRRL